jgi:hypothetical protein
MVCHQYSLGVSVILALELAQPQYAYREYRAVVCVYSVQEKTPHLFGETEYNQGHSADYSVPTRRPRAHNIFQSTVYIVMLL